MIIIQIFIHTLAYLCSIVTPVTPYAWEKPNGYENVHWRNMNKTNTINILTCIFFAYEVPDEVVMNLENLLTV